MTLFSFLYHSLMASIYNRKAAKHSRNMRHGETPHVRSNASKRLLKKGGTSNYHERERDKAKAEIKSWLS